MDTLKSGQPPYSGHTLFTPYLYIVHTFLPPKKGQPLKNGQNARPQCVHYSEVPLYSLQITVKAIGEGLDLPIFVSQDTIDLKICTTNSLYQDTIQVHNRGNTALRVAFTLPPELAPHLEISPPHGLVQGASSFSAQLKFLPLPGIFTECEKYFKDDCLRIPAEIRVVDQV